MDNQQKKQLKHLLEDYLQTVSDDPADTDSFEIRLSIAEVIERIDIELK
jgi:hypothetical protein